MAQTKPLKIYKYTDGGGQNWYIADTHEIEYYLVGKNATSYEGVHMSERGNIYYSSITKVGCKSIRELLSSVRKRTGHKYYKICYEN